MNIPFTPFHKIIDKPVAKMSQSFNTTETIREYNPKEPYYTVICQQYRYRIYFKNKECVILPVDVARELQGFPKTYFKNYHNIKNIRKMVGNAVPCQIGYLVCTILQQLI